MMQSLWLRLTVPLIAVLLASCSSLNFWSSSEPVKKTDEKGSGESKSNLSSSVTDVELKQARIWNRLDDLEDEVKVQRERIKLLEQGLLTGIAPEELKRNSGTPTKGRKVTIKETPPEDKQNRPTSVKFARQNHANPSSDAPGEPSMKPILDLPDQVKTEANEENSPANSPDSYRVRIQVAKDYYQASRFGMAVAEIAQITREFGAGAGSGEAKYWLGRSYLGLREYATAKAELEGFIAQYPQSEFVPNAKLELGRCLLGMNLRDRARREFAKIAKDYEGQDPGDIASAELRNLKGNL